MNDIVQTTQRGSGFSELYGTAALKNSFRASAIYIKEVVAALVQRQLTLSLSFHSFFAVPEVTARCMA